MTGLQGDTNSDVILSCQLKFTRCIPIAYSNVLACLENMRHIICKQYTELYKTKFLLDTIAEKICYRTSSS